MAIQLPTATHASPPPDLMKGVVSELRAGVSGEVRFDERARALYATDASPYEIQPYGVVLPKTVDDISHTLKVAREYGLPVLPRGGGTSLAGQTVGAAIVVDVSKYLTKILDFDPEAATVRVEPGVVRDELNTFLAPFKLQFTPDVSTTNRSNVGGMVANNSAGTRSIKYGKSVDQVISMTVMFVDGSVAELRELDADELKAKLELPTLEGEAYRTVYKAVTEHEAEIEAKFPKVMRRVGGYNLDEFTNGKPFNLAKLVSGSEGTLAFILDVTLKLYPVPTQRCLALLHYDTMHAALSSVKDINKHGPSAVELMDKALFDLGKDNPALDSLMWWLSGDPAAVLMVEFDGESEAEMLTGLRAMEQDSDVMESVTHVTMAMTPKEQFDVLEFRRGGLGIYATMKGDQKPTAFIEDPAIPPEHLADYIPEVLSVCERHGAKAVLYGHASVGVLHVRPLVDLKTAEGVETYGKISEDTFQLVKKYGGSWSGEHGDGLIRSYQNRALFGDVLYQDFSDIKRAFDPDNLMNPGKIVAAQPMTENLRYGEGYPEPELKTTFHFEEGGLLEAAEMCTGVGACRKVGTGTMCPSYMATRDEDHSTRGRANILREAITGKLPGGLTSQDVYDVLDLCLECKACKAECPSQVDMAKMKYEFLQHYYDDHGTPLAARAFGEVYKTAPLGQALAPIANAVLPTAPFRWVLEKTIGVDKRRVMPRYAEQSFASWVKKHQAPELPGDAPTVALFADTWTMYNETGPGVAATRVLEALGYQVEHIPYRCCGRTLISKGLVKQAKLEAAKNVTSLQRYAERGVPVVGLEPSCVTAFQDDYLDLLPGEATEQVAGNVAMIDQFLAKEWTSGNIKPKEVFEKTLDPVMLHGHCQQRAVIGTSASQAVLGWVSEDVHEVDSGCCGMAGSFGYSHYDVSMEIGEQRLFPAVRAHDGEVAACGFSCRHQIHDGTDQEAKHVAELLAEGLKPKL